MIQWKEHFKNITKSNEVLLIEEYELDKHYHKLTLINKTNKIRHQMNYILNNDLLESHSEQISKELRTKFDNHIKEYNEKERS